MPTKNAEHNREYQRNWQRSVLQQGRNISKPPKIGDVKRRSACKVDLAEYLLTYHDAAFPLAFSPDHRQLIDMTQSVVMSGGQIVAAMPRGSGKTTIFSHAILWASLYGHRLFPMLLCADDKKFKALLRGIKKIFENNQLLFQDFPEVVHPIRQLERIANRANMQTCEGKPTYMRWGTDDIIFPTTPWTIERGNAGVIVGGGGLTGAAVRGGVVTTPSGEQRRPSCCLIDDPQTRKSAKSESQCQEREDIVNGDIMGMAGPGKKMAAMCAVTVIYQSDLADRLLDKERSPSWTSIRVPMIKSWPTHMDDWEKYDAIRRQELYGELPEGTSNAYYEQHRERLDAGGEVYWEERILEGRVSALQSAMDDYFSDPRSFMAEKQNLPESTVEGDLAKLDSLQIVRRITPHEKREVPAQCTTITAHVDVQGKMLFWMVCAWSPGFGGFVIDYGTTPRHRSRHFTLYSIKTSLTKAFPGTDEPGALRAAIKEITEQLSSTTWNRTDGAELGLSRGLIDARWLPDHVEAGLKLSSATGWMPAYGVGIRAKDLPLEKWTKKRGVVRGHKWLIQKPDRKLLPSVFYDTNYWKTETHQALIVAVEHTQSLSFYKGTHSYHQMLADHICAETATRCEARGRIIDEWDNRQGKDNHWWDTLVGCRVAASLCGISKDTETHVKRSTRAGGRRVQQLKI